MVRCLKYIDCICLTVNTRKYVWNTYLHYSTVQEGKIEKFCWKSHNSSDFNAYTFNFFCNKMWSRVLILTFFLLSMLDLGVSYQYSKDFSQKDIEDIYVNGRNKKEGENSFLFSEELGWATNWFKFLLYVRSVMS